MKRLVVIFLVLILVIPVCAEENSCTYLARIVANEMKGEPFIAKVAYCEMLLNCVHSEFYPDTLPAVAHVKRAKRCKGEPGESDIYAAATALGGFGFFSEIYNVKPWREVKNTPLENKSGVRLYDWYFYG